MTPINLGFPTPKDLNVDQAVEYVDLSEGGELLIIKKEELIRIRNIINKLLGDSSK